MCRISATCSTGIETPNSASISETTLIWASEFHAGRSSGPVSNVSVDGGTRNAAATVAISLSPMASLSRFGGLWSVVQQYGFCVEAIDVLCGEPSERKAAFRCPPGRINECHGTSPCSIRSSTIIATTLRDGGDAYNELCQVPHEDVGSAHVVDPRERKPPVSANCLQGPVHHQVAVARGRSQQNVVIIR